ncbi:MAG: integrase, partial [SAR324 cluster bacterium]|nr:integrase [SAR324 cluster bacterium]
MEHFGGMKEFRLSLKCAIKTHANKTTKILERKVLRLYESIRQGMKSLDIEDIKEILRVEIRKQILHAHHVYEGTNRWSTSGVSQSLESVQLNESNLKEKLESS